MSVQKQQMKGVQPSHHHWTRQQFEAMAAGGIFHPEERVELIDGEIIDMSPQEAKHATATRLVEEALRLVFSKGCDVRVQMPLALDHASQPEPDIAVVSGYPRDYRDAHPTTALLVVEVAGSSLAFDQGPKRNLYARCQIPEYWIVKLRESCLEVYRKPKNGQFEEIQRFQENDRVTPLHGDGGAVQVADILP